MLNHLLKSTSNRTAVQTANENTLQIKLCYMANSLFALSKASHKYDLMDMIKNSM